MYITGRIKEILITSGGENVAPVPIEQEMKNHLRLCSFCVVVGDGRKYLNMLVTLKSKVDEKGVPIDELNQEAVDICNGLGVQLSTVSEAMQNAVVNQYIQDGMDQANKKAPSPVASIKVMLWFKYTLVHSLLVLL